LQCLDNLSQKIGGEISNINFKIESFNSKMAKVLNSEFKAIRDKITQIFEAAFRESDKFIKDYMRLKEQ
jgi:ferritin